MVAGWVEAFEDLHNEPGEIIELAGRIVVDMHVRGRVRGSGEEVDMDEVWVVTERDEKIIEIREYNTKEEALRSLGEAV
jgi:ketosteroid isomerase-like protein